MRKNIPCILAHHLRSLTISSQHFKTFVKTEHNVGTRNIEQLIDKSCGKQILSSLGYRLNKKEGKNQ
ncbi:hypothetical protein V1477_007382 [Vespula maculifrons]|uniref:Uncharacterized protein n=1 Tax=Vespula maculifrons TaxID=7453 RepID=A0ABD2CID9_VESMC